MTRQQQNDIIIKKITDKLQDQPNVQDKIAGAFTQWFRGLVETGVQLTAAAKQAPAAAQGAPAEQGAPA